jgi:hypothetical protein
LPLTVNEGSEEKKREYTEQKNPAKQVELCGDKFFNKALEIGRQSQSESKVLENTIWLKKLLYLCKDIFAVLEEEIKKIWAAINANKQDAENKILFEFDTNKDVMPKTKQGTAANTTPNFVPRKNLDGSVGTSLKRWLAGWFGSMDILSNLNVGGKTTTKDLTVTNKATVKDLEVTGTSNVNDINISGDIKIDNKTLTQIIEEMVASGDLSDELIDSLRALLLWIKDSENHLIPNVPGSFNNKVSPAADLSQQLGDSSRRWAALFASVGYLNDLFINGTNITDFIGNVVPATGTKGMAASGTVVAVKQFVGTGDTKTRLNKNLCKWQ